MNDTETLSHTSYVCKYYIVNGLKIAHYKTPPEHAIIIPHTGGVIHDTKATARLGQSC